MSKDTWIGFDLDKTLAKYESGDYHKYGACHIGEPIPATVALAQRMIARGHTLKIFSARVDGEYNPEVEKAIQDWTEEHIKTRLEVTNVKTMDMWFLVDDRAINVGANTGKLEMSGFALEAIGEALGWGEKKIIKP